MPTPQVLQAGARALSEPLDEGVPCNVPTGTALSYQSFNSTCKHENNQDGISAVKVDEIQALDAKSQLLEPTATCEGGINPTKPLLLRAAREQDNGWGEALHPSKTHRLESNVAAPTASIIPKVHSGARLTVHKNQTNQGAQGGEGRSPAAKVSKYGNGFSWFMGRRSV